MASRLARVAVGLTLIAAIVATAAIVIGPGSPSKVNGTVTDTSGEPVEHAVVRIQTTPTSALTDGHGRFSISAPGPGVPVTLTAWAVGYYIVGGEEHRPGEAVSFVLRPLPEADDPGYQWLSSKGAGPLFATRSRIFPPFDDCDPASRAPCPGIISRSVAIDPECFEETLSRSIHPDCLIGLVDGASESSAPDEASACAGCHSGRVAGIDADLPVDEWLLDAHSLTALNPRFLTMYLGTDVDGNVSPPTRFVENRDYGKVPLRPDPSLPYFGPGYRLDFPDSFGNCATCHTPMAAVNDPYGIDPTTVTGVATDGIGCDFCHKVWDVRLDQQTSLPDPNRPGVLSFEFRRPPDSHQFFAGPYDDVAPGEDTYVPLYSESAYCAACHRGVFWDTLVYDSYGEWLASPYADDSTGQTCQDCHMPPTGAILFAEPAMGGLERDPDTIPGHLMPGASDTNLLQNAVSLDMEAAVENGELTVSVEITNDRTGHHVPTDSPLRHMILLVEVTDPNGTPTLVEGPVVPEWGGVGDSSAGRYAGLPGTAYAKVLEELWTGVAPTAAYWNPTRILSDNRIPALGADTTTYRFEGAGNGATVTVTLVFRRAFIDLAQQKGWEVDDIVMETASVTIP